MGRNVCVNLMGQPEPKGYPMLEMSIGDVCVLTAVPSGHSLQPGEPVLRCCGEFYFLRANMWHVPNETTKGYYVRQLSDDESISIRKRR